MAYCGKIRVAEWIDVKSYLHEMFMDKITFGDSYKEISDPEVGVRRSHAIEAIQTADKFQNITPDDDKKLVFIKHVKVAKPPYTLIIIALRQDDSLSVSYVFKAYPTLVENIEEKSPLELLEHLANQFGLEFKIAGSQNKKFYLREKISVNNISISPQNDMLIEVDNPKNHKLTAVTVFKVEEGIQKIVNCALGFCIDMDIYSRWIKSKGEYSPFKEEILRLQSFTIEKILPAVAGKAFREKVFTAIHDFCFYCRQHPEALNSPVIISYLFSGLVILKSSLPL